MHKCEVAFSNENYHIVNNAGGRSCFSFFLLFVFSEKVCVLVKVQSDRKAIV